jgi:hypothetical protein
MGPRKLVHPSRSFRFGSCLSAAAACVASALWAGCTWAPSDQTMSLRDANFQVAWVTASQDGAGVVTLTVDLESSDDANPCPLLSPQTTVTVNGVPFALTRLGGLGSECVNDFGGSCSGRYEPICRGPQWSLKSPPTGPLAIVVSDSSARFEIDVSDMGTPRTVSVVSLANGAPPSTSGKVTLAWSPASDATRGWNPSANVYGMSSDQFGVQQISFVPAVAGTFPELDWYGGGGVLPYGVTAQGADVSFGADSALGSNGARPPPGGQGQFVVSALSYLPTSRCDLPNCVAYLSASPSVAADWQAY